MSLSTTEEMTTIICILISNSTKNQTVKERKKRPHLRWTPQERAKVAWEVYDIQARGLVSRRDMCNRRIPRISAKNPLF